MDITSGVLVTIEDKLRLLCYLPHGPIMQHSQLRASNAAKQYLLVPKQCLRIGVLCNILHLHRAVVGTAVEKVGTSSKGQSPALPSVL